MIENAVLAREYSRASDVKHAENPRASWCPLKTADRGLPIVDCQLKTDPDSYRGPTEDLLSFLTQR